MRRRRPPPAGLGFASDGDSSTIAESGQTTATTEPGAPAPSGSARAKPDPRASGGSTPVGGYCSHDSDCVNFATCIDPGYYLPGRCMCYPGLIVCGTDWYDLANDPQNCGACGHVCTGGNPCIQGICTTSYSQPHGTVDPPLQISGGSPTTTCWKQAEAVPTQSLSSGSGTNLVLSWMGEEPSPLQHYWNSATDWNNWDAGLHLTPSDDRAIVPTSDPWATSHGGTGLEYFSMISFQGSNQCMGIAAASYANLTNGDPSDDFQSPGFPAHCVNPPSNGLYGPDGPSMVFDPGSYSFYATYTDPHHYDAYLDVFPDCFSGPPGESGCPRWCHDGPSGVQYHSAVAVNPCTHHPMLAWKNRNDGIVHLAFYYTYGYLITDQETITTTSVHAPDCSDDSAVNKCGGPNSGDCDAEGSPPKCIRTDLKPSLAVYYDGARDRCYAYVATSTGCKDTNARKSIVVGVDITDEYQLFYTTVLQSSSCSDYSVDFNPGVTTNYYSDNVAFYFYRQPGNPLFNFAYPCDTHIHAFGGEHQFNGMGWYDMGQISDPAGGFPTIRNSSFGMGDYAAPAFHGRPGGWMLPTWAQTVEITNRNTCTTCEGSQWSLAVYGARLNP